jgi:Ca2+-binding EF-hand superfamily protein
MVLLATPALAATWADGFKTLDTDGSGTINRAEWNANGSKVGDPTMNPTFTTMDKDENNSIDQDEWAGAEGMKMAIGNACREATSSWCPCQNNPDDPKCQK